jgi:hypothetical protein
MCFSPEISFATSAALTTVGALTVKKVKYKKDYLVACFPILFGLQQFCEGIIWVTLQKEEYKVFHIMSRNLYMFFAFIFWPIAFPYFTQAFETNRIRKKLIQFLIFPGIALSSWYLYAMVFIGYGVVYRGSLIYYLKINNGMMTRFVYLALTTLPTALSSDKNLRVLSVLCLLSFLLADIFYLQYFASTWCFFAAIISAWSYIVINRSQEPAQN